MARVAIIQGRANAGLGQGAWAAGICNHSNFQPIAVKSTAMTASASCCEQNWSNYGFIHNRSRNRLSKPRAEKLVSLFSNLRLSARTEAVGNQQHGLPWEEGSAGEEEEEEEEGAGVEEPHGIRIG